MKAVVELGGKQYLIEPGTIFLADKVAAEKGTKYTTDRVLVLLDGDDVVLGRPYVEDALVTFTVLDQTKRNKVIVQKFRPKKGYLRTRGHRQQASQLQVDIIEGAGRRDERTVDEKKKAPKKKAASKVGEKKKAEKIEVKDKEPEEKAAKAPKKVAGKAPKKETKKASAKGAKKEPKKTEKKTAKKSTKPGRTKKDSD